MINRNRKIVYKFQRHKDTSHESIKGICFSIINKLIDVCEVYRTFYLCDDYSYRMRYDLLSNKPVIRKLPPDVIYAQNETK